MAKKNKHFKNKKIQFKKKHLKPPKKKRSYREIKHLDQRKLLFEEKTEAPQITNESEEEIMHVEPVDQLLSTFPNFQASKNACDSESSDDESENEETTSHDHTNAHDLPSLAATSIDVSRESHLSDKYDDEDGRIEVHPEKEIDETNYMRDPFYRHFTGSLSSSLLTSLQLTPKQTSRQKLDFPIIGEIVVEIPRQEETKTQACLLDDQQFVRPAEVPRPISKIDPQLLFIKSQIAVNIAEANKAQLKPLDNDRCNHLTPLQSELFSVVNNYHDLIYPRRDFSSGEEVRFVYCLHVVNHILKSRLKVLHHNERIYSKERTDIPDEFRDQGLVRPKALILVPFRDSAFRIVNMMSSILLGSKKANVFNLSRFTEEFTGSELFMPKKNKKPEDFEQIFRGNVDDSFRIGINFTKKNMKLYADFYSSDVIIATPLGIRLLVGAEGEQDRDYDFLASIELLIFDQADIFLMQNWDHVVHIMNHIHLQPRENHGTDFSRVRVSALNGWARFFRQTLILSSVLTPQLNALFSRHCANHAGAVRVSPVTHPGAISHVLTTLPHVYRRFKGASVIEAIDERFQFFIEEILPQFSEMNGVLIYVPSYFDFVRLRNFMKSKDLSFVQISEYSKDGKVARARDMFFHQQVRFLLYSERFHFYRRVNIKGIRHFVVYQPPTFPHFYSEICNMMQECNQNAAFGDGPVSVTSVICEYDVHALAGILRAPRAARILSSDKSVFMLTTGQA